MKILMATLVFLVLICVIRGRKVLLDPFSQCRVESQNYTSEKYENFQIKTSFFKKKAGKVLNRAILLLPPTGGRNIIDEAYAYMFCKKGFDVVILESWSGEKNVDEDYVLDFEIHQRYMERALKAINVALDNMDYKNVGVLGTSAGAINFNTALGQDFITSKVESFFNIVGAMPLCRVIATAGEQGLEKLRNKRIKKFNFKTEEEYVDKICSVINLQIPEKKPKGLRFGMILATEDKTVSYKYQLEQESKWSPDFSERLDSSHMKAIIKAYFFKRGKILKFFLESSSK